MCWLNRWPPLADGPGAALVGVLELFSLTPLLTPDTFGFILAAGMAGWGGLSVLCQTAAVLEGSGLRTGPCLRGKAVQGVLSALLGGADGRIRTGIVSRPVSTPAS